MVEQNQKAEKHTNLTAINNQNSNVDKKENRTRGHKTVIQNKSFFYILFCKGYFGVVKVSGILM